MGVDVTSEDECFHPINKIMEKKKGKRRLPELESIIDSRNEATSEEEGEDKDKTQDPMLLFQTNSSSLMDPYRSSKYELMHFGMSIMSSKLV